MRGCEDKKCVCCGCCLEGCKKYKPANDRETPLLYLTHLSGGLYVHASRRALPLYSAECGALICNVGSDVSVLNLQ